VGGGRVERRWASEALDDAFRRALLETSPLGARPSAHVPSTRCEVELTFLQLKRSRRWDQYARLGVGCLGEED